MKQVRNFVGIILLVVSFGLSSVAFAEYVHHGDYTTSGIFDGDLVIVNGDLSLKNTFTVNGDLKIISGKVSVVSDNTSTRTVDLYVCGDLIVTNTQTDEDNPVHKDATIEIDNGQLFATGEIFTYSKEADAKISAVTGIAAGKIFTHATNRAYIETSEGSIHVVGDITTKSEAGTAHIIAGSGSFIPGHPYNIIAAYISTNGPGGDSAYIDAYGSIIVDGGIVTRSANGPAYVRAATKVDGKIEADYIYADGYGSSYVEAGDFGEGILGEIDVKGDIVTETIVGSAWVYAKNGMLKAGNIVTQVGPSGYYGFIKAYDKIDVTGDLRATSSANSAYIESQTETIKAKSIITDSKSDAYVRAPKGIDVTEEIETKSFMYNSADVRASSGGVKAGSIQTYSVMGNANIYAGAGMIDVKGTINTMSLQGSSVAVYGYYGIRAENIYTRGGVDSDPSESTVADVTADDGLIDVKDVIQIHNDGGRGKIEAWDGLFARSLRTTTSGDGYVEVGNGSIIVQEDIHTKSIYGDAYVKAENGDVKALKLKTEALDGQDYIQAAATTGRFELVLSEEDRALDITNSEFTLDKDYTWNTVLSLNGTCTLNGKGHKVTFGQHGGIILTAGTKLFINNLEIDKIGARAIRMLDNSGLLTLQDVVWTQTVDTTFDMGAMKFLGDVLIRGPGTTFNYQPTVASTIESNATLAFGPRVTLNYNASSDTLLAMTDATSRLNFNDMTLIATRNMRFLKGTLVFDNRVDFTIPSPRNVYFGNGSAPNNVSFEYHPDALLVKTGSLLNQNA